MNLSAVNTTLPSQCNLGFIPLNSANISVGVFTVFVFKTAINICTCPFTILLNILVMVAVKTKRPLRTKSYIALACLATTDLAVGLILQPLQIVIYILVLKGDETDPNVLCATDVRKTVCVVCLSASLYHLFLINGERYLAIKHSFAYETGLVTDARIVMASFVAWIGAAVTVSIVHIAFETNRSFISQLTVFVGLFVIIPFMFYFNVSIYREVLRNEKQNIVNQVSLEVKAKLLKNKKTFYTAAIVLLTIILCYVPGYVWIAVVAIFKDRISTDVGNIVMHLTVSMSVLTPYLLILFGPTWTLEAGMSVLNSLLNPLIYAVRIRYFRVAFIQLSSRRTLAQAEELANRIFGSRRIGAEECAEQKQNRGRREHVQLRKLNNGETTTAASERIRTTGGAWL